MKITFQGIKVLSHITKYELTGKHQFRLDLTNILPGFYLLLKQDADVRIGKAKIVAE